MRVTIGLATAASLVFGQMPIAAAAQIPARRPAQEKTASPPPAIKKPASQARPAARPEKPGFGGSGSNKPSGGSRPGFGAGGSGGSKPGGGSRPDYGTGGSGGSKPGGGSRPDYGTGGSGGSKPGGGSRPDYGTGGSGGSWQRPPRPPVVRPPFDNGSGFGNSWGNTAGGNWNDWHGRIVRCESWNYRYARCNSNVRNGVRLVRVLGGNCIRGSSWGWSPGGNYVWVNRGCRADFQSRYGNWNNNDGPSTGAVIAGVAVAAGLIAILASQGRKADNSQALSSPSEAKTSRPATVEFSADAVPAPAQASFRLCVDEAARQIGATGGTAIRLNGAVETSPSDGGWRFQMPIQSVWPGSSLATPAFCRATPAAVAELSFYQG